MGFFENLRADDVLVVFFVIPLLGATFVAIICVNIKDKIRSKNKRKENFPGGKYV
jgi:hypothetical protein